MKVYSSLTRTKEEFLPLAKGLVGMYVCGPTVYDEPHIGHARSAYIFDVIRRYLAYKGYTVTFVRNVTDVDDKIIDRARNELKGEDLKEAVRKVADKYLKAYHEDMDALGIMRPDKEPKATEYIAAMQGFIKDLIDRGAAYPSEGDVYFDIKKAKDYGKLSHQSLEKMEAGSRVAPGEKKRDPLDFALWKQAKEGEPSWESPWGRGRPGWHIECSVMSSALLGDEFDIHGGGIDLIFPHHENEIAQSEGSGKRFARYWLHNGLLTINGEKMAKSLGNFITIKDFIARFSDPDYLKLFFLTAHYRSPIDYTAEKVEEAKKEKERFKILFNKMADILLHDRIDKVLKKEKGTLNPELEKEVDHFKQKFEEAMDDDFNTPLALASLFDLVTYTNKIVHAKDVFTQQEISVISIIANLLSGLSGIFGLHLSRDSAPVDTELAHWVLEMKEKRDRARREKDFETADKIRKAVLEKGIILEDTKDGTVWRRKL